MITPCFMGDWNADETGDLSSIHQLPRNRRLSLLAVWDTGSYESVVSAKNGIEYYFYGFAIINALVLGKVILVADDFHFSEWFKERAPIYSISAKALAFTILLLIFDIIEEVIVGKFKGKTFAESFPHVGDGSPRAYLYMIIIFAIALIPFFSFREIVRVFGERELRSLFFTPAKRS